MRSAWPSGDLTEPRRLDSARAETDPLEPPAGRWQRGLGFALVGSLGVHLLPALLLLQWSSAPPEIAAPIPVQVVFEPAPPAPAPEKPPPRGPLASDDVGETAEKPAEPGAVAEETAARPQDAVVAALRPPRVARPPELVSALPKPEPKPEAIPLPDELQPRPLVPPPEKRAVGTLPVSTERRSSPARLPGPSATRDEYLAYCLSLIRMHFGPLSPSFLAGRRGTAILSIQVLGNGTITHVAVARHSAYPEIDAKLEAAVAAVGRFPPVPQWFQGPRIAFTLHVGYPEGL